MKILNIAIILGFFLVTSASVVSAASSGGEWTSFTFNNNDTRYQALSTINSFNVQNLVLSSTIQSIGGTSATPIVSGGNVYFDDWAGYVYSANVNTGALNWKTYTAGALSGTPEIANGVLYVAFGPNGTADVGPTSFNIPTSNDLQIWAINALTGKPIWITTLNKNQTSGMDAIWSSPIIYNGLLYIGVASSGPEDTKWKGHEFALKTSNGAILWNTLLTNSSGSYGAGVWSTPVIDPKLNAIYIGTGSPYNANGPDFYSDAMMSLNATTGKINWANQICGNGRNICGDVETGGSANLFNFTYKGVTYEAVGAGRKNGNYYIFNRKTGALLENISVGTPENDNFSNGGIIGDAAMSNTTNPEIFVASYFDGLFANGTQVKSSGQGVVEAFYPSNGVAAWRHVIQGFIYGSVTLIPGAVVFGDSNGNVYAFSSASGNQLFHSKIPDSIAAGVTVAEGYLLVPGFTSTGSSNTFGLYVFTVPAVPCTGTPSISISPNPAAPSASVIATVSGLSNCAGTNVNIISYEGCSTGSTITSFFSGPTGGNAMLTADEANGNYGYWACVNGRGTETTLVVNSSAATGSCLGTPSIGMTPNPASPSASIRVTVSGLSNCSGTTISLKSYEGCATGSTITSFVSGATGGNALFTAPGGPGSFGYWACINGTGTKVSLNVSTANALSIAAPTPPSQTVSQGNTITISDTGATGGTAPYTYNWLEEATGASSFTNAVNCASANTITCTFATNSLTTPGTYNFELNAKDSASNTITSTQSSVEVSSASCTGTPSIVISPNHATASSTVNAIVSGLTSCSGVTVDIDSYQGCTTGSLITSFISGPTGGNALLTSPGGPGNYGYWGCVNGQGTEATLNVT